MIAEIRAESQSASDTVRASPSITQTNPNEIQRQSRFGESLHTTTYLNLAEKVSTKGSLQRPNSNSLLKVSKFSASSACRKRSIIKC